ncbi:MULTISPECIES: methyltransferase domain-containing protein [unclassified Kribbella]|uniref:TRM11 family SAM-dependent methyltransferase n=1 Tax=unclassified Kribbella TaxID=2644121 RepID=UPI0033D92988
MCSARLGAAESITRALSLGNQPLVLVRTVTGLERLAAAELTEARHRVIDLSKRQLIVEPTAATIVTTPPRLADDLFLIQAAVPDPGRVRPALTAAMRGVRLQPCSGDFAVSASFAGQRNFTRYDVEDLVGDLLHELSGGTYHSRRTGIPPADRTDWRVVLDGTTMWVGVRPFDVPLHRRAWRRQTVTGSLHPPVAAAMARLARIGPGHRVLDPFCGAGTLLLEAHAIMPEATYLGSDRKPAAIAAARQNSQGSIQLRTADAGDLRQTVDRIITNPPWDVRVAIGNLTPYLRQWRRTHAARVVTILNPDQSTKLIGDAAWRVLDVYDVAIAGQHPRILVAEPTT